MPSTWTTDSERKLFLAIIEVTGVKTAAWEEVAEKMGPGYTKEAVRQHFSKIKKQAGPNPSPTKATPKTPTKNGTPKKTAKSTKRKQADAEDDDDDDDNGEDAIDLTNGANTPSKKAKKMKEENDIPRTAFKSEMIDPEGQIDLEADADIYN